VLAPLALITAVMPGMRERGLGRIVNIASATVREPSAVLMLSNAHRSATLAAFKTLARDVAGDGVTLNTVLPGRIATERAYALAGTQEKAEAFARSEIPAKRLGTPQELAAAVAFLCSARASYITGVALIVDGGMTRLV
jgi:3-oxoacyl-[acyl-carrier protein] reductase